MKRSTNDFQCYVDLRFKKMKSLCELLPLAIPRKQSLPLAANNFKYHVKYFYHNNQLQRTTFSRKKERKDIKPISTLKSRIYSIETSTVIEK